MYHNVTERSLTKKVAMEALQIAKGEQIRQKILAAAQRRFLGQGLAATPMRQIGRAVGVTPAAITLPEQRPALHGRAAECRALLRVVRRLG